MGREQIASGELSWGVTAPKYLSKELGKSVMKDESHFNKCTISHPGNRTE